MVDGRVLWAWPVGVVGSFDVPLDVLAFDDAWCRAAAPDGVEPAEEAAEEIAPARSVAPVLVRGEMRLGGRGFGV